MASSSSSTTSVNTQIQAINTVFFHGSMSENLGAAVAQAADGAETADRQGACRALRRADLERVPSHSLRIGPN